MFILKLIKNTPKVLTKTPVNSLFLLPQCSNFHNNGLLKQKDVIKVEISGRTFEFPHVWLRDNCRCSQCFHPTAKSRILNWSNFNLNTSPDEISKDKDNLHITWDDGHKSTFSLDWLRFRSFSPENQKIYYESIYQPPKITWKGEDFEKVCSKHDYNEIINSDLALYNWLYKFSIYGVALIKNTPNTDDALDNIISKVAFPKKTHYGIKFVVQHVSNTSNVAYLSSNLQMHTDLPYYEYCPGVNMLHCLVQTKSSGGENLLTDCHFVADYMKEHHPEQYRLLTDTIIEWSDIGTENKNEFFKLYRSPVICLDKDGRITRINLSIPQRGSQFPGPINIVKPWYEAHKLFFQYCHSFAANFKSREGDILVFDNIRLLHGRNAYEDTNDNVRKLIGAYVDWDEIYSRLRCLKLKLESESGLSP